MSKDIKRIVAVVVCLAIFWTAIFWTFSNGLTGRYIHSCFFTKYTKKQHIERISERTEERFKTELKYGTIVNYTVDILYAFFDNNPEYFLVELEYAKEWTAEYPEDDGLPYTKYTTKYKHFIGYIEDDCYWTGLYGYSGATNREIFIEGRSAYTVQGYTDAKKYYGQYVMAVKKGRDIYQIFNKYHYNRVEFGTNEEQWEQRLIKKSEYWYLMQNNRKVPRESEYY